MAYYEKSTHQTLEELNAVDTGLSHSEAAKRLEIYGPNSVRVVGEPLWRKLIEPFANVFMLVLFIAAIMSFASGARIDGTIIASIMAISATIYYVQKFSTERILRALQKHHAQSVEVMRGGKVTQVDASLLVPGDIILVGEGEKIPADARLVSATQLRVDEAQLTGESAPISKQVDALSGNKEVYEQTNTLFQGSFVTQGEATAVVVATGNTTEFGQLATLASMTADKSPVQQKIDRLLTRVIMTVSAVAVVAFALASTRGMSIDESLHFVLALSVSAVPESLPVAISIILVLGMRRMAAKKALVRSSSAIETIGAITTIATDKTGTLTKNKLSVISVWHPNLPLHRLAEITAATINYRSTKLHDPLDTALHVYVTGQRIARSKHMPLATFPFDQSVAMSGNLWHYGTSHLLAVKGAPEHVLERCDLTEAEKESATIQLHKMIDGGNRVIAIAYSSANAPIEHLGQLGRHKLTFAGFVAVADILRTDARQAILAATQAGVTVRMITGDHFETAYHIGRQLGLVEHRDQVFDSRKMHVMSDKKLEKIIGDIRVFSRVIPEHKHRILSILKKSNITAMTGDGVNDVPALANANVGIAMGSGSQIAKDAGDIILMNDSFKGIVDAMHEGRTVISNVRRMLFYLLATNTGEVIIALGSLIIGMPIPIIPVQILWINLVTDTALVIPLGLEPGEKSNMRTAPKRLDSPILSKFTVSRMIVLALTMATVTLCLYVYYTDRYGVAYGRTIAFSALVVMQWASAMTARSDYTSLFKRIFVFNGKFYAGLTVAITLQALALFGPLGPILHVTPVAIGDLFISGCIAFMAPIIITEIHKYIGRTYIRKTI